MGVLNSWLDEISINFVSMKKLGIFDKYEAVLQSSSIMKNYKAIFLNFSDILGYSGKLWLKIKD